MKKVKVQHFDAFNLSGVTPATATGKGKKKHLLLTPSEKTILESVSAVIKGKQEIASAKAKMAAHEDTVKGWAKGEWLKMYGAKQSAPDTFNIAGVGADVIQFQTRDAYPKLDEERFKYLQGKYGDKVVEAVPTFIINPEVFDQHREEVMRVINEAIANSKLPDEAKKTLIKPEIELRVKPGMVKTLHTVGKPLDEVYKDITPIVALK